ncbi:MAG: hypothetical protein ACRD1P_08705 [Thermoanaerobaculia bacterium]
MLTLRGTLRAHRLSDFIDWEREIHHRVEASHFLWKMIRRIVGALVEVGRGNLDASDIERLLREKSNEPAKWTAPPSGLFLEKVSYPKAKEIPRLGRPQ